MTPEEWERFQKRQARKFERPKRNGSLKFFSGNLEEDIAPLGMLRAPPREGHITAGKMNWKDALQLSRDENRRSFEFVSQGELIMLRGMNEIDGGYTASALGVGIHTEADTLETLRANVREAVDCYYDEGMAAPTIIRLHFVRDEVLAR